MIDFDNDIVDLAEDIEYEIDDDERLRLLMVEFYFMLPPNERVKFKKEIS